MRRALIGLLVTWLVAGAVLAQDARPAPTNLPPLEQCQWDNLELREALISWQERAIRSEAALARQQLAKERAALEAKKKTDQP